jgi:hypothetical protein
MSATPPVNFETKKKESSNNGSGYPYQIKASDLDQNFTFATLDIPDGWYQENNGAGGHKQRKLLLPAMPEREAVLVYVSGRLQWFQMPTSGTHVLGAEDGEIKWLETESC